MHDKATLEQSVDGLIRQIKLAVAPDSEEMIEVEHEEERLDFSVKDLRDELDRLKSEQEPAVSSTTALKTAGQPAKVPAVVPRLPDGCLVSSSMEELLEQLTTGTSSRVGFLGMGGIGKTVISTWLVRHDNVREKFDESTSRTQMPVPVLRPLLLACGTVPNESSIANEWLSQLFGLRWAKPRRWSTFKAVYSNSLPAVRSLTNQWNTAPKLYSRR